MKRIYVVLITMLVCAGVGARERKGQALADVLTKCMKVEDVHPDSLYPNLRMLEAMKRQATSQVERAVLSTALGKLYANRVWRAEAYEFSTPANPDSLQEWAQMDWFRASARNFREAFEASDLLAAEPVSDWLPLTEEAQNSHRRDMLGLLWHSMTTSLDPTMQRQFNMPTYAWMIDRYTTLGAREAALLLELDSLETVYFPIAPIAIHRDSAPFDTARQQALEEVRLRYADLDVCAEVYLALAQVGGLKPKQQQRYLQEGLRLYPRYERRAALSNALRDLEAPIMEWCSAGVVYPERSYEWAWRVRNVQSAQWFIYQLPANSGRDLSLRYVKKYGRMVQNGTHHFPTHDPVETFTDTLTWTAPAASGYYAVVLTPVVKAKTAEAVTPLVGSFTVTKKKTLAINLPDGSVRCEMVDAVSGMPLDCDCEPDDLGRNMRSWRSRRDTSTHHFVNLFTDRAIYRPGQTVHVAGVAYSRKEWEHRVTAQQTFALKFYDTNHKLLRTLDVTTDAYGTFAADLELPAEVTGYYQISCGTARRMVRVEEYKRPTFEVTFDPAPEVHYPVDSLTLTGRALHYNGTPVRQARLTGSYNWQGSYWWREIPADTYVSLDTLQTDAEGRFTLRIAVPKGAELYRYGMWLRAQVAVTSADGETHEANTSLSLCSQTVRLRGLCPAVVNRRSPSGFSLMAYSSSEKEMTLPVHLQLLTGDTVVADTLIESTSRSMSASMSASTSLLMHQPVGRYTWRATAVHEGDTAHWSQDFLLADETSATLPVDTALWCYLPNPTFAPEHPTHLQLGSSLPNAYIYLLAAANDQVVMDTTLLMSGALSCELPYKKEYGNALTISVALVRDECVYTDTKTIRLQQPDTKLRCKWNSFRDLLRPGQEEEWTLTLTRPDGTPADASLLVAMYDASLDAFGRHSFELSTSLPYYTHHQYWTSPYVHQLWLNQHLRMPQDRVLALDHSCFAGRYFEPTNGRSVKFYAGGRNLSRSAMMMKASAPVMECGMTEDVAVASMATAGMATFDMAEEEEVEGSGVEEDADEEADAGSDFDLGVMRSNFAETAFFLPRLVTDEQGQVAIRFTLPESLTQWHLLGVAHTPDLLTAQLDERIIARKELMGELHLPRFLRQGDKAVLTSSINNISGNVQEGKATLTVLDGATEKVLMRRIVPFNLSANADTLFTFAYEPRRGASSLLVRWQVQGTDCSDGEQRLLPILTDREWVTDTRALWIDKVGKQTVDLKELSKVKGDSMRVTVEYTTRPIWLALEALPTMASPCRRDAISLAVAYYALGMTKYIKERVPACATDSILSSKALDESARSTWLRQLRELQNADGSFSWYPGLPASSYITTEVAFLLARLQAQTEQSDQQKVLDGCLRYLSAHADTVLCVQSLRQMYLQGLTGTKLNPVQRKLVGQLSRLSDAERPAKVGGGWEGAALTAIVLQQQGYDRHARRQVEGICHHLVTSPERGTYIDYPEGAHSSIDTKLRLHTLLMEALQRVTPADTERLSGMRRWLLQQKRVQGWDTPMQCADAVYALLDTDVDFDADTDVDLLTLRAGKRLMPLAPTDRQRGYVRRTFSVDKAPTTLQIDKHSRGESWGAVFVESLQELDSIQSASTGLRVRREQIFSAPQPSSSADVQRTECHVGDRVTLRYVMTADRDYEFVSLSAERPACLEPTEQLSRTCWQDGLCFYRSVRDSRTEYFFQHLPRGTYVIEEAFHAERSGSYATGLAVVRCEYAKEFQGRTTSANTTVR